MKGLKSKFLCLSLLVAGIACIYYPHWRQTYATTAISTEFETIVTDRWLPLKSAQEHFILGTIQVLEGWTYWGELSSPVTTSFQYQGKHILIAVRLQSKQQPFPFIFDTGMKTSLIDRHLAEQTPFLVSFRINPQTLYGVVEHVQIADATFHQVGTFAVPFSTPGQPLFCLSDSGALGGSLMHHGIWQINYQNHTLTVSDDISSLDHIQGAITLPFELVDLRPIVRLTANHNVEIPAMIDTGWNGSIHLADMSAKQLGTQHLQPIDISEGLVETLGGWKKVRQKTVELSHLSIGSLSLNNFPVSVDVDQPLYSDTLIGNDFLEHFILTLDYTQRQLYLFPTDFFDELYPSHPLYGFQSMMQGNKLIITGLRRPSAAVQAGLQIGDQIISVNQDRYDRLTSQQVCNFIQQPMLSRYTGLIKVQVNRDGDFLTCVIDPDKPAFASSSNSGCAF
ncbi:retroviral-like aspartic protease family protein [Leptolyngbya iicbica]|uniref:PDZ domain-containing protein n=2 Tax=Cyanophyceae TaxID=3028117 RepID=A0A4Q7E6T7_9CYAN|nr:retroviral-like aspartic protease family protein [Leptolyngbya sp. LK]RZM77968.1 hypothetical protein DYY88_15595 [Leptolyngbya sp. LK]